MIRMNEGIILKIQNKYKIYYGNNKIDRNGCAQLYYISLIIGAVQLELFQNGTLHKKFRFLNINS